MIKRMGNIYAKSRDRGMIYCTTGISPTLVTSSGGVSAVYNSSNISGFLERKK